MGFKIQKKEEEEKEKKDEGVLKSCVKLISEGEEVKVNSNIYSSHFILVNSAHDQLSSHSSDSKDVLSCYDTLHYTTQYHKLPLRGNVHIYAGGNTEHTQWVAALTTYSSFLQDITQPTPPPSRLRG
jgi:hypothetical protein